MNFSKKMQKVARFVKKHEHSSIWLKTCNFSKQTTMFWHFDELFRESCKNSSFREKARKIIDLAKSLCNFSNKLPCLCISINFSAKSCKKCLISWKARKIIDLAKTLQLFEQTTMSFAFRWTFQEKSCKKCLISWKSTKNHRFGQIATFRENYHVLTFWWTLQQKLFSNKLPCLCIKFLDCREKARKIINLAKSLQLFEQTSMFFSMNFQGKSCKKCLISWKSTKNHRFGQNFATFQATMSFSFWWTFKLNVLAFRWSFQQKVAKSAKTRLVKTTMFWRFGEKSSPRFLRKL